MDSDLKQYVARLSVNILNLAQVTFDLLILLSHLNVVNGVSKIVIFSMNQLNTMINYVSTA